MKFRLIIEPAKGQGDATHHDTDRVQVDFTCHDWTEAEIYAAKFQEQVGLKGMAVVLPMEINRNLINAYRGAHEGIFNKFAPEDRVSAIKAVIRGDEPLKRLRTYLEWNGIQGYMAGEINLTETIYGIATSEPAVKD